MPSEKTPPTATTRTSKLAWWFGLFGLLGFADATYLTAEHVLGEGPACSVLHGCDTVLTSQYATIGPVPLALIGSLYYLAVLVLVVFHINSGARRYLDITRWFVTAGFVASLYFVYLQVFVLEALCVYCMGSAITTTLLFGGGWVWFFNRRTAA